MDLKRLAVTIGHEIVGKWDNYQAYRDYFDICREIGKEDIKRGNVGLRWLSEVIDLRMGKIAEKNEGLAGELYGLHKKVLGALAVWDFDSYLRYMEWNRAAEKQFYMPRRKSLKVIVDGLQGLADDRLDLLAVSVPPGCGKTTLALFYMTWVGGKYPDSPILMGSHSAGIVRGAYDECLRMMDANGEYLWREVFPGVPISNTNAKEQRIDLGRRKRFETMEFTTIGASNAGQYRASSLLYCDDLVSGIEVAMSKERLDKLWEIYNTDLRQRMIGNKCKELHIATRWSVHDVLGRLEDIYGDSPRAKFIVIPALNENDESNFDYPYGVGFSTEFYHKQRDIMDDVNWRALFMNQPIEREGLLYSADELRRYFELPDGEPDAILAVCDTKTKGADYCVMPVVYQYGPDFYVDGVICDNGNPDTVEPRLAQMLVDRKVHMARFESNQAGGMIAEKIQGMVKEMGGRAKLTTKYSTQNKETRIICAQPWIIEHCLFKDDSVIKNDKEYRRFLKFLTGYTIAGKNKHDDVPDAMAMLSEYIQSFSMNKVEIVKRPF